MIYSLCLPNRAEPEVCTRCGNFRCWPTSMSCRSVDTDMLEYANEFASNFGTDEIANMELTYESRHPVFQSDRDKEPAFICESERGCSYYISEPGFLHVALQQNKSIYVEALPYYYEASIVSVEVIDLDFRMLREYLQELFNQCDRSHMLRHLVIIFREVYGMDSRPDVCAWLVAKEMWLSELCTIRLKGPLLDVECFVMLCRIGERVRIRGSSWKTVQRHVENVDRRFRQIRILSNGYNSNFDNVELGYTENITNKVVRTLASDTSLCEGEYSDTSCGSF